MSRLSADLACPKCDYVGSKVIECRGRGERTSIIRRRQCLDVDCSHRWTTYESELPPLSKPELKLLEGLMRKLRMG